MTSQFKLFLTAENFRLAFMRLKTSPRDLYKDLFYQDIKIFELFLEDNIHSLIHEIEQGIFTPQKSHKIFIPKKNNLVRPLSLLNFKDLLVYQAIVNIVADATYYETIPYYNNIIFGNSYHTSEDSEKDRIFFFKPWKKQWKKFEEKTKEYYQSGYQFLSEFDIASFFDTIDHSTLCQILKNTYQIDNLLLEFLLQLLEIWTADFNYQTFIRKNGIPQGPLASAFLADLYLLHLDLEFNKNKLDIQYIRYVDDIRIFSKNALTGTKAIASLDLLARDLGLIPQSNKINITQIKDISKIVRHQKSKLSLIAREYKRKDGELKSKTHKKLKERFLDCFDQNSKEEYLDKTIIKFALYKLNKDKDVKETILKKCKDNYIHYEAILYYLRKHFYEDNQVRDWLVAIITKDELLFHHAVALILKFFPDIQFISSVYTKYMRRKHRHWLVRYYMIFWLHKNKQKQLIFSLKDDNYFINRELNNIKFYEINDVYYEKIFIADILTSNDTMVSLQGLYFNPYSIIYDSSNANIKVNEYVKAVFSKDRIDYVNHILKKEFLMDSSQLFLNKKTWNDEASYKEIGVAFTNFFKYKNIDAPKSLINLNLFNELIFDKVCLILNISKSCKEYGTNLKVHEFQTIFPVTTEYFALINNKRNQKTDAHPYDKSGKIRIRIEANELEKLISYEMKALK